MSYKFKENFNSDFDFMDAYQLFSSNFQRLQEEKNIASRDIARRLGLKEERSVGKWRSGKAIPHGKYLKKIADMFGVTVADLFAEDPNVNQIKDMSMDEAIRVINNKLKELDLKLEKI